MKLSHRSLHRRNREVCVSWHMDQTNFRGWEGLYNPLLVLIFPWASSKPSLQLGFWQTELSCQTRFPLPNRSQIESLCPLFRSEITPYWLIQLPAWHISTLQSNFPGSPSYMACRLLREAGHKGRGLSSEENKNLNAQWDINVEDTGNKLRKNNWHLCLTISPGL